MNTTPLFNKTKPHLRPPDKQRKLNETTSRAFFFRPTTRNTSRTERRGEPRGSGRRRPPCGGRRKSGVRGHSHNERLCGRRGCSGEHHDDLRAGRRGVDRGKTTSREYDRCNGWLAFFGFSNCTVVVVVVVGKDIQQQGVGEQNATGFCAPKRKVTSRTPIRDRSLHSQVRLSFCGQVTALSSHS